MEIYRRKAGVCADHGAYPGRHFGGGIPARGPHPTGAGFAAQAQVNPNTMQRALLELEREGLLISCGTTGRFVTDDAAVLEGMRAKATDAVIRACAEQFKALGLSMQQAAQMLMQLEGEERNG